MSQYTVCGYDMEVLHERQLEVAIELDRICRENGIKYSLYGGSVIGAVRHNGFIPWDHDIDVAMMRKDYEKFIKYCKSNPSDRFFFSCYKTEPLYPNSWGKFRLESTVFLEKELASLNLHKGVFIDVHPIDNIIPCFLKLQVKIAMFFSCVHHVKCGIYSGHNKFKICMYRVFSWLPYSVINGLRDIAMRINNIFPTKYVYKIAHPNGGIYPIRRKIFEDTIEHRFESQMFFIPRDYDEFLKDRYGDYMKFPPESEIYECCGSIVECKL
jgi:lipopolysaccharide cholinephosphotransferase